MDAASASKIRILAAASGSRNFGRWYAFLVSISEDTANQRARAGLCADCSQARTVEGAHRSRFYLCERSASDPTFPKYPRLPVLACPGFVNAAEDKSK